MKRHNTLATAIAILLVQLLVVALIQLSSFRVAEPGALFVAMLFSIPPLLQMLGIILVRSGLLRIFYSLISFVSSGSYIFCWIYYMSTSEVSYYVTWICLSLTGVLVVVAFLIASAIFRDHSAIFTKVSFTRRLSNEIGTSPSGEILLFLAFFISVGYLISFSLAFSDKYRTTNGLLPGLRTETVIDSEYSRFSQPEDIAQPTQAKKWLVVFDAGRGVIAKGSRDVLNDIINALLKFDSNQLVRVTLIGRSDASPVFSKDNPYRSNYELAEARAVAVRFALQNLLSERRDNGRLNIEWLIVPLSESTNESVENRRSVEVSIQPLTSNREQSPLAMRSEAQFRLLTLIEYVYFAMYTITTTGYGDIKPSTSYTMFICTLTNLYETFFLVIFFNVLLSPKARALSRRKSSEHTNDQSPAKSKTEDIRNGKPVITLKSAKHVVVQNSTLSTATNTRENYNNTSLENRQGTKKLGVLVFCIMVIVSLFKKKEG